MTGNHKLRLLLSFIIVALIAALPLTALATAEEDANKELANRWVQDFLLTGNLHTAVELASPDFVAHDLAGNDLDLAAFRAEVANLLAGTRDRSFEIKTMFAEDDVVAMHWIETGTLTWRRISPWTLHGIAIVRITDGRIAELWYSLSRQFDPA